MPEKPQQPDRRNWCWHVSQKILQATLAPWTHYRARGHQDIDPAGGLLLINHTSFLDPIFVGLPLKRPISYLARDSLFRVPILGGYLKRVEVIPINRESTGTGSIRDAIAKMRDGYLVGIFPEGTRSADGQLAELKPGFVALVRRAGVAVYPVGISGAFDVLSRNHKWPRPKPVRVVFGEPFSAEELQGDAEQITKLAQLRIQACITEAEEWLRDGVPAKT